MVVESQGWVLDQEAMAVAEAQGATVAVPVRQAFQLMDDRPVDLKAFQDNWYCGYSLVVAVVIVMLELLYCYY